MLVEAELIVRFAKISALRFSPLPRRHDDPNLVEMSLDGGHFKPCARAANRVMSQAHYGVQFVFGLESFEHSAPINCASSGMFKRRLIPSGLAFNCSAAPAAAVGT